MRFRLYWRGRTDNETGQAWGKHKNPRRATELSGGHHSAARRTGIVAVGVFRSELSVDFMHHHFAFLILGDFSGGLHRRFLRGMVRRVPCVAVTKNSPEVFATGNDMLIFAHTSLLSD